MSYENLNIDILIEKMATDLQELLIARNITNPDMIGVQTGGVWVAEKIAHLLDIKEPLGTLNINFYRDDFSNIGLHPNVGPSNIKAPIADRHIIIVDDVLHTGRTIRAALNEVFDYGRPASVILAILIDRGGRELPIVADVCGETISLSKGKNIKIKGPNPLKMEIL